MFETIKGVYAFLPVDADVVMTTAITDEKVLRYEAFLNDQLKPDLKAILEKRDKGGLRSTYFTIDLCFHLCLLK